MDDDGGCVVGFMTLLIIGGLIQSACENRAEQIAAERAERLAANPPGPAFPWGWVILTILCIIFLIAAVVAAHHYVAKHKRLQSANNQKRVIAQQANERERKIVEHERKVFKHWQHIRDENALKERAFLEQFQKAFRASIALRVHRDDQNTYATFRWSAVPERSGSVFLYRGKKRLFQKVDDVECELGEKGLIAVRGLARSGYHRDEATDISATYYLYWKSTYEGIKPALILNGKAVETYHRDDLLNGFELTTIKYRRTFRGGLRKERLTVPPKIDPLDREERSLDQLERAQYLQERRASLTGKKTTDVVSAVAEQAVEEAIARTKKDADIQSAVDAIQGRDDLSEEAKAQAVATLQSRFSLDDPDFDLEEVFDYET